MLRRFPPPPDCYLYGPVCVDAAERGKGLAGMMFADLRARLQELDESIKPENIERSLAGVGSTRPEELREARRRQLSIQRDGVRAQLQTLETSRTRLETAIANAEALAYQQSARPQSLLAAGSRSQWMIFGGGGLGVLALGGAGALLYRRTKRKMIS
jgi:hypothetical protein